MLLKDKVVVVSGIGPGLGKELALEAARQGAKLAICARTASRLDDTAGEIEALGLGAEVLKVPTDISDRSQCRNLVEQTAAHFGRVDALINSAYNPGDFQPIESADLDGWRAAFDVNLFGTLQLTQECIGELKKTRGSIVMINTMVTRKPLPTQAGYAASKAALLSATQHLALELGGYGIRVNSTFMGWMWGPPVEGYFQAASTQTGTSVDEMKAAVEKNIALGKIPDDADCAKPAIFLASDYACAMTGACVDVNGGDFLPH